MIWMICSRIVQWTQHSMAIHRLNHHQKQGAGAWCEWHMLIAFLGTICRRSCICPKKALQGAIKAIGCEAQMEHSLLYRAKPLCVWAHLESVESWPESFFCVELQALQ